MPVHFPVSFCAVNPLTPGLWILRFFTEKGAPVSVWLHRREVTPAPAEQKRANQRIITHVNPLKVIFIWMCFSHFLHSEEVLFITHLCFFSTSRILPHSRRSLLSPSRLLPYSLHWQKYRSWASARCRRGAPQWNSYLPAGTWAHRTWVSPIIFSQVSGCVSSGASQSALWQAQWTSFSHLWTSPSIWTTKRSSTGVRECI